MDSLTEVYELCQGRGGLVTGGMAWLRTTNVTKRMIVDLSGLGSDQIEKTGEGFRIGCMGTLRQMEAYQRLNQYFGGIFRGYTRHIVGVQAHNCATVGGGIYSRFGFSDILACTMALNTYVELYHGGIMPLSEFTKRPIHRGGKNVLVHVIIKKDGRRATYTTQRNSNTDFPLLACYVSRRGSNWYVAVGARSSKAQVVTITSDSYDSLTQLARGAADPFTYGTSTKGNSRYCRQLTSVCIRHPIERLTGRSATIG